VGFQRVSISLDGPDQETHDGFRRMPGAFTQAVDGFLRLKELGMAMQVNTTVTLHNREQLNAIYALVRKLGAVAWHLFLLVPVGCGQEIAAERQLTPRAYEEVLYWIEEVAQEEAQGGKMEVRATCAPHAQRVRLQRQAIARSACSQSFGDGPEVRAEGRRGCLAGTGICFISHRGEVFPCGYLPVLAGNIRLKALKDIWQTASVFLDLRDPDRLMGKCGACEYRAVCGGCRARAFGETGHYLHEEPSCNYLPLPIVNGPATTA
jgi:radical SAM protein with 4Fe4S-binding SPASM domain